MKGLIISLIIVWSILIIGFYWMFFMKPQTCMDFFQDEEVKKVLCVSIGQLKQIG